MQCRICLGDDSPETLLRPCRCSGTIAYVHRACLDTYLLYVPDEVCRVCRTPFQVPRSGLHPLLTWGLLAPLAIGILSLEESAPVRCVYALVFLGVVVLYSRGRAPPPVPRLLSVLLLWGCLSWTETAAGRLAFLAILALLCTVYTLCLRLTPLVVLVVLMHLLVMAYVGVLTTVMLASFSPPAFALYLTLLYLLWDLWIHAPRLNVT
jgi:hypothetical protein